MNIYWKLYLLTRLDGIIGLCVTLTIIAFLAAVVIIILNFIHADFDEFYYDETLAKRKNLRTVITKKLKWIIPIGFICLIFSIMIPSKNETIFIVAGGKTIDWVQNDTSICKIPSQTTAIVSEFLDKQIKELKTPKKDK
jgi:hypothetical protein